ncbi:hypothetical protein GBA52_005378 [Prunus armeniaca]|nr:hypothetical protein GBA52_005378 [Prunus armeniaca]
MDVFSFGVVLLELVSGKPAIDEVGMFCGQALVGFWRGMRKRRQGNCVSGWTGNFSWSLAQWKA